MTCIRFDIWQQKIYVDRPRLAKGDGPIGAYRRIPGLRVTATDMAWHAGYGPEVRGPAEAILLVTAGRSVALEDLSGPGVPALRRRMDG